MSTTINEIDRFLKNYRKAGTIHNYKSILTNYFDEIHKKPDGYFKKKNQTQYQNDVQQYFNNLNNKNIPPYSMMARMSCVKTFFMMNEIEFRESWWKMNITNKKKGKGARTRDTVPETHELKQILIHADCKERAFFLTLATSGARIGEICQIKLNDIHLNKNPVEIDILGEYTKSGERRVTFITDEAKACLVEWLKIRQQYLNDSSEHVKTRFASYKTKDGKTQGYSIDINDPRVFPFSPPSGRKMWEKLVTRAGFNEKDQSTKRLKCHPHTMRKWYITTMKQHIPEPVVDKIVGHEGYLSKSYDRYTEKDMARLYKENCGHLAIFETVVEQDLTEINESLKQKDKDIEEMKKQIAELRLTLLEEKINNGRK